MNKELRGGNRKNAGRKPDDRFKLTITLSKKNNASISKSFRDFEGVIDYVKSLQF